MTVIDISVFILYLIGIVLFGSSFYRKNKTASAFTLGNNTLPGWVITLSILATWWKLASIFSGGMLGLFLLGYLVPKIKNTAAIIGVVAGVLVIGWMSLSPMIFTEGEMAKYASPFHSYLSIVLGTMTIFIVGFLIGIVVQIPVKVDR